MKLACSILFSIIIFLSGSKNLFFIIDYHANRNFYESVCENKSRPELECHGKCQVTKDIQKDSKSFSFSNLGFDFHFEVSENIPTPKKPIHQSLAQKVSNDRLLLWNEIPIGVPDPPPNFKF